MRRVAVLGGGNGAHAAAADLTLRGFAVNLYEDAAFAGRMQAVFETGQIKTSGVCGKNTVDIAMVTSDLAAAVEDVDTILLVVPAFAHSAYAEKLAAVVKPGQLVLLLPGTFGSLLLWQAFKNAGVEGVMLAESHTLPYTARLTGPGEVAILGRFDPLKIGVMPAGKTGMVWDRLVPLFPGLEAVESVLACGLSSLNPVIHVPCCILNAGRIERMAGEFYFYTEGFTDGVVRATEAVDAERTRLLQALGYRWLDVACGIAGEGAGGLREVVAGNESFKAVKGPAGFENRYYTEDIPYGLALWVKLGRALGVATPVMESMVALGSVLLEEDCMAKGPELDALGLAGLDVPGLHRYVELG